MLLLLLLLPLLLCSSCCVVASVVHHHNRHQILSLPAAITCPESAKCWTLYFARSTIVWTAPAEWPTKAQWSGGVAGGYCVAGRLLQWNSCNCVRSDTLTLRACARSAHTGGGRNCCVPGFGLSGGGQGSSVGLAAVDSVVVDFILLFTLPNPLPGKETQRRLFEPFHRVLYWGIILPLPARTSGAGGAGGAKLRARNVDSLSGPSSLVALDVFKDGCPSPFLLIAAVRTSFFLPFFVVDGGGAWSVGAPLALASLLVPPP